MVERADDGHRATIHVDVSMDAVRTTGRVGIGWIIRGPGFERKGSKSELWEGVLALGIHFAKAIAPDATKSWEYEPLNEAAAEYAAIADAISALSLEGYRGPVTVYGDSQSVIDQLAHRAHLDETGENFDVLSRMREYVWRKAAKADLDVEYVWIPREDNSEADRLAKEGRDQLVPDVLRALKAFVAIGRRFGEGTPPKSVGKQHIPAPPPPSGGKSDG